MKRRLVWIALAATLAGCTYLPQWPWPFRTPDAGLEPPAPDIDSTATKSSSEGAATVEPNAAPRPVPRAGPIAEALQGGAAAVESRALDPAEANAPKIMEDSITKGAFIGSIPLLACVMSYACTPDALLVGAALLVAGTLAGVVVGTVRVIADGSTRPPATPPASSHPDRAIKPPTSKRSVTNR